MRHGFGNAVAGVTLVRNDPRILRRQFPRQTTCFSFPANTNSAQDDRFGSAQDSLPSDNLTNSKRAIDLADLQRRFRGFSGKIEFYIKEKR